MTQPLLVMVNVNTPSSGLLQVPPISAEADDPEDGDTKVELLNDQDVEYPVGGDTEYI